MCRCATNFAAIQIRQLSTSWDPGMLEWFSMHLLAGAVSVSGRQKDLHGNVLESKHRSILLGVVRINGCGFLDGTIVGVVQTGTKQNTPILWVLYLETNPNEQFSKLVTRSLLLLKRWVFPRVDVFFFFFFSA